jgi:hypothetical protein
LARRCRQDTVDRQHAEAADYAAGKRRTGNDREDFYGTDEPTEVRETYRHDDAPCPARTANVSRAAAFLEAQSSISLGGACHPDTKRGTRRNLTRFIVGISSARRFGMDQRDRELLDKQMGRLQPTPGQAGTLIAVVVGVFLVGVTFGGLMFSSSEPIRVAANDVAVAPLLGTPPMTP